MAGTQLVVLLVCMHCCFIATDLLPHLLGLLSGTWAPSNMYNVTGCHSAPYKHPAWHGAQC